MVFIGCQLMHLSEQLRGILGHCREQHLLIEEPGFGVLVLRTADAVASLERDNFFFLFFLAARPVSSDRRILAGYYHINPSSSCAYKR